MTEVESKIPRRERERLRHRQEILDATLRVVSAHGIEGVTIEQVAREAEYAVGSIYRYFRSKDELVSELLADLSETFLAELESVVAGPQDFEEKLEHAVQLAYDRQIEFVPVVMAFFAAPGPLPDASTPGGAQLHAMRQRQTAAYDALLAKGQAEGRVRPGDRAPLVVGLTGLITSFARSEAVFGQPFGEDTAAELIRLFLWGAGQPAPSARQGGA